MSKQSNDTNGSGATYPLMDQDESPLHAANGRAMSEITMDAASAGLLDADDMRIDGKTLKQQAAVARQNGFSQLAGNLDRAAELTVVPNEQLLQMYELLRPRRATYAEMMALANRLDEEFEAIATAKMVREAATVYQERDLLKE
ncbi:MAG: diol dehydratase small subunit [Chloroflexota bacterium]